jgi:hypothetical protein
VPATARVLATARVPPTAGGVYNSKNTSSIMNVRKSRVKRDVNSSKNISNGGVITTASNMQRQGQLTAGTPSKERKTVKAGRTAILGVPAAAGRAAVGTKNGKKVF